ncbi:MAG: DUF4384 domain-containing protein [Lewinellaceae bacterium]|nr:DUF4384 domain-containing protein [Lewinellaceae bacterium]
MGNTAPNQQPQAEGSLDQELLGGRLLERPAYYRVTRWNDPGSVVVNAGWVQGLNKDAVVALYPAETRDPAQATPLAKGTVTRALPFEATLQLDNSLREEPARSCWVYVLEPNFGDQWVGFSIQLPDSHPVRLVLQQKLPEYKMIRLGEAPEAYLTAYGAGTQLIGAGDMLLTETDGNMPPDGAAKRILGQLKCYAGTKYFRKLEARGSHLNVDFEIVPIQINPNTLMETATIPLDSKRDALGNVHFQYGDVLKIRVTNRGNKAAYFTLLDIQPNHVINPLIPGDKETAAEFRIGPGQTVDVPKIFTIGPPAGVEVFKLIATEEPVDLRPMLCSNTTRGSSTLPTASLHVHSTTFIIDK